MGSEGRGGYAVVDRRKRSSGPCHKLNLRCGELGEGEGEGKGERKERDEVGGGGRGGEEGRKNGKWREFSKCVEWLSPPAQLQCSHSGVGKPGNEANYCLVYTSQVAHLSS